MLAVIHAHTFTRIIELMDCSGVDRDEPETVGEILIVENGGVFQDFYHLDGEGWGLDEDDAS